MIDRDHSELEIRFPSFYKTSKGLIEHVLQIFDHDVFLSQPDMDLDNICYLKHMPDKMISDSTSLMIVKNSG